MPTVVLAGLTSLCVVLPMNRFAEWLPQGWWQYGGNLVLIGLMVAVLLVTKTPRARGMRWVFLVLVVLLMAGQFAARDWLRAAPEGALQARFERTLERFRTQGNAIGRRLAEQTSSAVRTGLGVDLSGSSTTGEGDADRLALFRRAQEAISSTPGPADSLFIVDQDGVAEAWFGSGLRHPLPEADLPEEGLFALNSFTATTLGLVVPLAGDSEGRRLVVGSSYSGLRLPRFLQPPVWTGAVRANSPSQGRLWSVEGVGQGVQLVLQPGAASPIALRFVPLVLLILIGVLACDLLLPALAALPLRRPDHQQRTETPEPHDWSPKIDPVLTAALWSLFGLILLVAWYGRVIDRNTAFALVVLSALCPLSLAAGVALSGWRTRALAAFSLFGCVSLTVLWLVSEQLGQANRLGLDRLGERLDSGVAAILVSLLTGLVCFSVLSSLFSGSTISKGRSRLLLLGAGALLLMAHGSMPTPLALVVVCLGGAMVAARPRRPRARGWLVLVVAAVLVASSVWTVTLTGRARSELEAVLNPTTSSFSSYGRSVLREELAAHFDQIDIEALTLGLGQAESHAADLPLLLWLSSPLGQASGPSAVRVTTGSGPSFFGFGLAENDNGEVDLATGPVSAQLTSWAREAMVRGVVDLVSPSAADGSASAKKDPATTEAENRGAEIRGAEAVAFVEFFVLPTPKLRTGAATTESDLARRFLLGESFVATQWSTDSALAVGPWGGEPGIVLGHSPLVDEQYRANGTGTTTSDVPADPGQSRNRVKEQWFEESLTLVRTFPPNRPLVDGLLRTSVQLSLNLLVAGLLVALSALLIFGFRRRGAQLLGPFSRRLVLAFALLASVPIVLLSVLLLRSFSERLQVDQRAGGEAALSSAERMVGDYLSSLEPGFSVTTVFDDELLSWISLIVGHEVNLYWRGNVLTSSRPELFASGLLPSQIPGDVFAALDLEGRGVSARTNSSAGGDSYLELYRQVGLPDSGGFGLFVSVPLLAQQLETTFTLRRLLNQALVLATFLTLLLIAVAIRFAEGLTMPITAIVAGTQRIAAGDPSLGHTPKIPELKTLADAIDDMARRIASGRERLVREKQVVDTVIANIKSAVVSFGENQRVIMTNREAADLLGVRAGDSLEQLTERLESKELALAVGRRPQIAERTSVRLDQAGHSAEWTVQWLPIAGSGDPAALLVIEDVTEVLKAQRLAAWAEMARIIAHEVKNPLTPIRLSADHLRRVYQTSPEELDGIFERCIDNILAQVDELRLIAEEFSTYSRIPSSNKILADLADTVREVLDSYRSGSSEALAFTADLTSAILPMEHDRRLIGRVLRNLYENAIRACEGHGRVHLSMTVEQPSDPGSSEAEVVIVLRDSGPGVAPADLHRIFEPTFSASTGGTGLGLPIAKSIIEDHGGTMGATNASTERPAAGRSGETGKIPLGGLTVSIRLPLAS